MCSGVRKSPISIKYIMKLYIIYYIYIYILLLVLVWVSLLANYRRVLYYSVVLLMAYSYRAFSHAAYCFIHSPNFHMSTSHFLRACCFIVLYNPVHKLHFIVFDINSVRIYTVHFPEMMKHAFQRKFQRKGKNERRSWQAMTAQSTAHRRGDQSKREERKWHERFVKVRGDE
jgi:hypothetical protein